MSVPLYFLLLLLQFNVNAPSFLQLSLSLFRGSVLIKILIHQQGEADHTTSLLSSFAAGGVRPVSRDLLIAQRGPGDLIGDMGLFSKHRQRQATVRCSSQLVVRVILPDQLEDYLSQNPLARHQMRENILKKESEVTMVEALMKLANVHEVIVASLEGQLQTPPGVAMSPQALSPRTPNSTAVSMVAAAMEDSASTVGSANRAV
jgi:CRP-like cAMP-binding protein